MLLNNRIVLMTHSCCKCAKKTYFVGLKSNIELNSTLEELSSCHLMFVLYLLVNRGRAVLSSNAPWPNHFTVHIWFEIAVIV